MAQKRRDNAQSVRHPAVITTTFLRDNNAEIVDRVLGGERFLVTRNNRIVMELGPSDRRGDRPSRAERRGEQED